MGESINSMAGGLFHMLRAAHKQELADLRRKQAGIDDAAAWRERVRLTRIERALSEERMCNRYADDVDLAILREEYGLAGQVEANTGPSFVHPGTPGRVVTADRYLRQMIWGFPFAIKGKKTGALLKPKPVNNARTDKLATFFWRDSFENRRCLIPTSRFCEAEGEKGRMTQTWYSNGSPLLTTAGIWRDSNEWGRVYSMVMTDSAEPLSRIHDRMPVVLTPADYDLWLNGNAEEAFVLCRPVAGLIEDRTDKFWAG